MTSPVFSGNPGEPSRSQVVILAPTANDARLTAGFLEKAGITCIVCQNPGGVCREIDHGCGCILLAEEALHKDTVEGLVDALDRQPSWSDIPIVIVASGGEASRTRLRQLAFRGPGGNISILERPFRPFTLVSAVAVALKARARQYEVRDLLDELGRARDKAETASQAKDDFLATLSHELRTPLSPILLLASSGATNPNYAEEVRANFAVIRKNAKLEARLIDDLLDLTRITRGKLQLETAACDIHDLIEEALGSVRGEAAGQSIRIVRRFRAERAGVIGDPMRLQQIFWNILRNAVKFSPPGGAVTVETHHPDPTRIGIRFTDEGIGISQDELEHIFDAFSQGGHASTPGKVGYPGLGLGLSIARMLTSLHSGTIRAQSEGPGQGAVFDLTFPLADTESEAIGKETEAMPSERPPGGTRKRILLVEDHRDTLLALSLLLGTQYEIVATSSGREARAEAARAAFDLVISDIGLPDETGYELMAFLQSHHRLHGIALSGYGMEADIARGREAGFMAHLIKPIEWTALERALAAFFSAAADR